MSRGYWFAAIAVGLTALVIWYCWHQVDVYQAQKAEQSQYVADAEARTVYGCFSNIQASTLIRCLYEVTQANPETERSNYDLQAQQDMAVWAYSLLFVSIAGTVLSAIGLVALLYSLDLNRKAVKAAEDAVAQTSRIGEAQVRAYVRITGGSVQLARASKGMTDQRIRPKIAINVRNYGQSPALRFRWSIITRYSPPMGNAFLGSLGFASESWGEDIGCNEEPRFTLEIGTAPLDESAMSVLSTSELHMNFVIRYVFRDVFGRLIEDERVFTAYVPKNGIGIDVPLTPHVFDRETIERLIEANSPENIAWIEEATRREDQDQEG